MINRKSTTSRKSRAAVALAASMLALASVKAEASIICNTGTLPTNVPNTTAGVYTNFVTGATNVSPALAPGWDLNTWGNGGLFSFFWSTAVANVTQGLLTGGVHAASPAGVVVGPGGTYAAAGTPSAAAMAPWRAGVTGAYIGIRFTNEVTGVPNFGWAQLNTTGPTSGFPATITGYCYQNDGTQILTGDTPVTLDSFQIE